MVERYAAFHHAHTTADICSCCSLKFGRCPEPFRKTIERMADGPFLYGEVLARPRRGGAAVLRHGMAQNNELRIRHKCPAEVVENSLMVALDGLPILILFIGVVTASPQPLDGNALVRPYGIHLVIKTAAQTLAPRACLYRCSQYRSKDVPPGF